MLKLQDISPPKVRFADDRTGETVTVLVQSDDRDTVKERAIDMLRTAATILLTGRTDVSSR